MRTSPIIFFSILILLTPLPALGAVFINEVAWMGTNESANDEWIELYNDGTSSENLSGWTLTDNGSLSVTLEGSIGLGNYFLLERTDDESVPGISADQIYTGALSNSGVTLTLRNAGNGIEDQVAGGENWENIGGNNETKDTAQLTSGGWITALPSPKNSNESEPSPVASTEETEETAVESSQKITGTGTGEAISLKESNSVLKLNAGPDRTVYVNQEVSFTVEPSGISEKNSDSLVYQWNFGDGYTHGGKEVSHTYAFPGQYVVVVHGAYIRHDTTESFVVTVLPTSLELVRTIDGNLLIHNNAARDIDVSGFTIHDGGQKFSFPKNTFILSRGTLTLAPSMLDHPYFSHQVVLHDTANVSVAALSGSEKETGVKTKTVVATPRETTVAVSPPKKEVPQISVEFPERGSADDEIGRGQSASVIEALPSVNTSRLPIAGLIGVISLGVLALYARRTEVKN